MQHFKKGCSFHFSTAEVAEINFRYQDSRVKKADFGATPLRTIGFKEITDVLLLDDRKLSHHVKTSIDFNLSGVVLSWPVITF